MLTNTLCTLNNYSTGPKRSSISLYDQPFSEYNCRKSECRVWPQIFLEYLTVIHTLYTLRTPRRGPKFAVPLYDQPFSRYRVVEYPSRKRTNDSTMPLKILQSKVSTLCNTSTPKTSPTEPKICFVFALPASVLKTLHIHNFPLSKEFREMSYI